MNVLEGRIYKIETNEGISLIDINIDDDFFSALIINSKATGSYIKEGENVKILFKETEISLKRFHENIVKRQNKIIVDVISIEKGQILSEVKLLYRNKSVTAIVLTRLLNELQLNEKEKAVMVLRPQEILLAEA